MFNKVILVGNLTRDPELRYLQSGSAICNAGIATNRRYKSQTGEQNEEVCFIDIVLFGRTAEIANQYLKKGSKVLVEGRLKFEQWNDQSGQKRSRHTVVVETLQMLDNKGQSPQPQESAQNYSHQEQSQSYHSNQRDHGANSVQASEIEIDDDEIPF